MVPQAPCSPARQCWIRAFGRAKAEKLIPYRNADGTWTVKTYTVTVVGAGWSDLACSCPAGANGRICKHAAVVAKAISAHVLPIRGTEKGKEVAAPAAPFVPQASVLVSGPGPLAAAFA